ncbi:MAG: GlsB/YeaQ/YmgE family stress response membrane protein [Bacteroidales bacterium]|nr:GlsB/YeaQ/YmgE family stress response membrane protein [Bacteroidales bacterium]MBN2762622.1 GlsB/YeaQ/YmgE family stress response membrane protein [Bacteroidales bacterium]
MGNIWPLIIQLVSGALGGTAAGALMKKLSLGTVLNSILGIVGGGLGGQLLNALGVGTAGGGMDLGGIITSIVGGGVGGGILLAIIGLIKKALSKS